MKGQEPYSTVRAFAEKSMMASAGFFIIAVPAVVLSTFMLLAERIGISPFVIQVLTGLEYAILVIDSSLLLGYLICSAWEFLREMFI